MSALHRAIAAITFFGLSSILILGNGIYTSNATEAGLGASISGVMIGMVVHIELYERPKTKIELAIFFAALVVALALLLVPIHFDEPVMAVLGGGLFGFLVGIIRVEFAERTKDAR